MSSASTRDRIRAKRAAGILLVLLLSGLVCLPAGAAPLNDTTKAIIVSFHYQNGTTTPSGSRVIYGHPPDNVANRDYLAALVDKDGAVRGSYGIEDPRIRYSDKGAVMMTDVRFSVILPFAANGDHVDLSDGMTMQKLATADISGPVAGFCSSHKEDPDCSAGKIPAIWGIMLLVLIVIAGAGAYLYLKRKKGGV